MGAILSRSQWVKVALTLKSHQGNIDLEILHKCVISMVFVNACVVILKHTFSMINFEEPVV